MNQILISLGILALWALTSLLSRDAQPLPARPTRDRPGDGDRRSPSPPGAAQSGVIGSPRTTDRKAAETIEARRAERFGEGAQPARYTSSGARLQGDGIRILESDTRNTRPLAGAPPGLKSAASILTPGSRSSSRRASRSRTSSSPAPGKPSEPQRPRALSSQIHKSMAQTAGKPLEITPLELPLESLSSSHVPLGTRGIVDLTRTDWSAPGLDARSVGKMLASPEKLREVAILTEVLKPPLALRGRRRIL
jgi:hypothetical protein